MFGYAKYGLVSFIQLVYSIILILVRRPIYKMGWRQVDELEYLYDNTFFVTLTVYLKKKLNVDTVLEVVYKPYLN